MLLKASSRPSLPVVFSRGNSDPWVRWWWRSGVVSFLKAPPWSPRFVVCGFISSRWRVHGRGLGFSCSAWGGIAALSAYVSCLGCVCVVVACICTGVLLVIALYVKWGESLFHKTIMKAHSDVTTSKRAPQHGLKPVVSLFLQVKPVVSQPG